jgi:hypothetical protein
MKVLADDIENKKNILKYPCPNHDIKNVKSSLPKDVEKKDDTRPTLGFFPPP